MALVFFHRGFAAPLWAIAFFAVALAAPAGAMPPVAVLLGIALLAFTMMATIQWGHTSHVLVQVPATGVDRAHAGIILSTLRPSGRRSTHASDDALDLIRMDDDGGWQMAREPSVRPVTTDAVAIAEREREAVGFDGGDRDVLIGR